MATPAQGLERLLETVGDGTLDTLCARHRVRVLTAFGSAARGEPSARDLDVGALFERSARPDVPGLLDDLGRLTGADVDLVHLNRGGSVVRERALVGAVPLFESEPGALATAQSAAVGERIDTFAVNGHVVVSQQGRAPDSYADSFTLAAAAGLLDDDLGARLVPSARMRNVLVHAYLDVDHDLVAAAVPLAIEQYEQYVRQVAGYLRERSDPPPG